MNMAVKMVGKVPAGSMPNRRGMKAQRWMKASPPLSSTMKNSTLSAMSA
jgi:hypothetical protein